MAVKKIKRQSILRNRRRRVILFRLGIGLGGFILLFVLVLVASWQSYLRINEVNVKGNMAINAENIAIAAKVPLANNYGWIWPKNFFLWYPRQEIQDDLKAQFPRLLEVDTDLGGFSKINVEVVERKPIGVWCGTNKNKIERCFMLDETGYVFDVAPDYTGSLFVHYFGKTSGSSTVAVQYLTENKFIEFKDFLNNLHITGLDISDVEYIEKDDYFNVYLANGPRLLINCKQSYDITFRNILALLKRPELDLRNPKNLSRLQYLDLRFGNKISYKERGAKSAVSATSTSTSAVSSTNNISGSTTPTR